jgi:uncharacterized repeat protein (TIGR01451 family)
VRGSAQFTRRTRRASAFAFAGVVAVAAALALPAVAGANAAQDLTVSATATPTMARSFTWSIQKSVVGPSTQTAAAGTNVGFDYAIAVTKSAPIDSGWKVTGVISITNPNPIAVTGQVAADVYGATNDTCTIAGGSSRTVNAGATAQVNYTCTFSSQPSYGASTVNATVTWTKTGASSSTVNTGTAAYQFANGSGNPTVTHDSVAVWDQFNGGANTQIGTTNVSKTFSTHQDIAVPSGSSSCSSYDNMASFTPINDGYTPPNTSTATVTVCPTGHNLTVSKTADATYQRAYGWTIAKSVDRTSVTTAADTATFNYTVVATKSDGTDSGWKVTGAISVTNPNSYAVTNVVITDGGVNNGGVCKLDASGSIASLAAGATASVPYTCTWASAPTTKVGSNVGNVTWTIPASGGNPATTGSASVTQGFAFLLPTTVLHDSANVTDLFAGGAPAPLGSGAITTSTTFTYARTVAVPASGCAVYDNTATVTPTDTTTGANSAAQVTTCRQTPPSSPPPTTTTTSVPPTQTPGGKTVTKANTPSKTTVSLTKRADASVVKAGGRIGFTITWKNTGKATAKNVKICDALPTQLTFVSAKGATFAGGKACWKKRAVAKGATLTFRVVAHVAATVGNGTLVNVAHATASNAAPKTAKAPVRALRNQRTRVGGVTG